MKNELLNIFIENGVQIFDFEEDKYIELSLESIQFISILVEIENHFSIMIPDEYLLFERLPTLDSFFELICSLRQHKD